jgi:hypothetical protein
VIVFKSGQPLNGYSLKIGYTEPKDKEVCLSNFFIRLLKQGYMRDGVFYTTTGNLIEPVDRIEMYQNNTYNEVYTFWPRFAEPNFEAGLSTRFIQKIEDFYRDWNNGMDFTALYDKYYVSRVRKRKAKYDLSAPRFFSRNALNEYAKKLIEDGENPGEVQQYVKHYGHKFLDDATGFVKQELLKNMKISANRANYAQKTK